MQVEAQEENLLTIDRKLEEALDKWMVEKKRRFLFAIHEAVINAIEASKSATEEISDLIDIHVWEDSLQICAKIKDPFGGIPKTKSELLSEEDNRLLSMSETGRGILFIDHMVDEYHWQMNENGKFEVYMAIKK